MTNAEETGSSVADTGEADVPTVSPAALAERLRSGESLTILDVRDRDEFERWHVTGPSAEAVQISHQKFLAARVQGTTLELLVEAGVDPDEPVVVVCGRGEASADVADQLQDAGVDSEGQSPSGNRAEPGDRRTQSVDAANLAGGMEAWARLYEAVEVPLAREDVTVLQYRRPSSGCLAYLVISGGEAVVVDPLRAFAARYAEDAVDRDADLVAAVDTHVHADHVSGVREVAESAGADVVVPEGATDRGLAFEPDRLVADGDEVRVGDATLTALHAPGHTSEMTAFRLGADDRDLLFGGDLLFLDAVARPDLEVGGSGDEGATGDAGVAEMARTLHRTLHERVLSLPADTRVLPGHFSDRSRPAESDIYEASLGELRERIDLLGLDEEAFVDRVTSSMPPRPANHEEIVAVNLGRESADSEAAFELELGPNNCAVE